MAEHWRKLNIEIVFASDSNLEEIDAVLQRINAKLQNVIMDMEERYYARRTVHRWSTQYFARASVV